MSLAPTVFAVLIFDQCWFRGRGETGAGGGGLSGWGALH